MQNLLHKAVNCHSFQVAERVNYVMKTGQFLVSDKMVLSWVTNSNVRVIDD